MEALVWHSDTGSSEISVPYLPTEMLSEIVHWVVRTPGAPCLRRLCLASSTFRALAQPLLLRKIHIGTCAVDSISSIREQIEELSTGNCLASKYARTLVIDYHGGFLTEDPSRIGGTSSGQRLKQAILSFKNVEKVIWYPRESELPFKQQSIGHALIELGPKQISIELLDVIGIPELSVEDALDDETLSEVIKSLIQRSPRLTHLELNIPNMDPFNLEIFPDMSDTSLANLEHLALASVYITDDQFNSILYRLPNLKSLYFHDLGPDDHSRYDEQDTPAPVWETLEERKINLLTISTNTSNFVYGLLSYLGSYHGVEHLELDVLQPTPEATVLRPFKLLSVLSQNHGLSLLNLSLRVANGQNKWMWQQFTENMKACLFTFRNLRSLELTARGASVHDITSLLSYCDRCFSALEQLILDGPWSKGNQNHGKFTPISPKCDIGLYDDVKCPAPRYIEPTIFDVDLIPRFNHHSYIQSEIDSESEQTIWAITHYNGKRAFETPAFSIVLGRLLFLRLRRSKTQGWRYVKVYEEQRIRQYTSDLVTDGIENSELQPHCTTS